MEAKGVFGLVSRESALVLNNVLLSVAAFVVFVGTLWPLIAELAFARKLSVGAPFFDQTFTPFMVLLALIMPVGAMLPWKRANIGRSLRPLYGALALALALGALAFAVQTGRSALAPVGVALGVWLVAGAAVELWQRAGRVPARLARLPRADWGKAAAHSGLGITFIGIACATAWNVEDIRVAKIGESFDVGGYTITLAGVEEVEGPNFISTTATMRAAKDGREVAVLHPEKRVYPVAAMPTTEAAIANGIWRDLYVVIGDPQADGGWTVRTYIKPFANWIWAGAIVMALGGLLSLSDRRFRIAAGARRSPAIAQPAE
jgi:cytochrome c-type biogenesis protein CcmF